MAADPISLDFFVQRMAALPTLRIPAVVPVKGGGEQLNWEMAFNGGALATELAITDPGLSRDVSSISVQVAYWGRISAQARRGWQFAERCYRVWRDSFIITALEPKGADWKKPTEKAIEAMYRSQLAYSQHQAQIEACEESYNGAQAMFEGLRAKKDMLRTAVIRTHEDSAPRLAV
jgi:hypothetical protein